MSTTPDTPAATEAVSAAVEAVKTLTPEERQQQFQAFMGKMLGDTSRLRSQVDYLGRHFTGELVKVHDRIDHIENVLAMICESLHIEMPRPQPKLLDAQIELSSELGEGEVCEMQASYSDTVHPIFGNLQILLGPPEEIQVVNPKQFNPIIVQRLEEAFQIFRQSEGFVDGKFYYVRLSLIHAEPIDASSVSYAVATAGEAANDDASTESADVVQPE